MATTLAQDIAAFDRITTDFGKKRAIRGAGGLQFAGNYWPPRVDPLTGRVVNSRLYSDVETAFNQARRVSEAYILAKAAMRGSNTDAVNKMTKWFGDNTGSRSWWEGAVAIIGALESFLVKDVHVYYRGDRKRLGQPNDYPNDNGNLIARDFEGYAESSTSVGNNIVGLCEDFFNKTSKGAATVAVRGEDSVAGVLLHELSHNICGTEDHEYSRADAEILGNAADASKAWYNADNVEYFCEDVFYGI